MLLLGVVTRPTADLDVVALVSGGVYRKADPLPDPLVNAVADVGLALELAPTWLNAGPASLMDFGLPAGFDARVTVRTYGRLVLHLAGRADMVCCKLYASVDQGPDSKHFADLSALQPTRDELIAGARWAVTHDTSPAFREELLKALGELGLEVDDDDL